MARSTNEDDDGTREAILLAALHRFAHHGYRRTSLKSIAADIGATAGAINHHFGSKPILYGEAGDVALDRLVAGYGAFEKATAGEPDQRRRVEALFQQVADTASDYLDHHWIGISVVRDAAHDEPIAEIRDSWARQLERLYRATLYPGTEAESAGGDGWDSDPATVLLSVFVLGQAWMVVRDGPESLGPAVRGLTRFIGRSATGEESEEPPRRRSAAGF